MITDFVLCLVVIGMGIGQFYLHQRLNRQREILFQMNREIDRLGMGNPKSNGTRTMWGD